MYIYIYINILGSNFFDLKLTHLLSFAVFGFNAYSGCALHQLTFHTAGGKDSAHRRWGPGCRSKWTGGSSSAGFQTGWRGCWGTRPLVGFRCHLISAYTGVMHQHQCCPAPGSSRWQGRQRRARTRGWSPRCSACSGSSSFSLRWSAWRRSTGRESWRRTSLGAWRQVLILKGTVSQNIWPVDIW